MGRVTSLEHLRTFLNRDGLKRLATCDVVDVATLREALASNAVTSLGNHIRILDSFPGGSGGVRKEDREWYDAAMAIDPDALTDEDVRRLAWKRMTFGKC